MEIEKLSEACCRRVPAPRVLLFLQQSRAIAPAI